MYFLWNLIPPAELNRVCDSKPKEYSELEDKVQSVYRLADLPCLKMVLEVIGRVLGLHPLREVMETSRLMIIQVELA